MSAFDDEVTAGLTDLSTEAGTSITYRRGAEEITIENAVRGRTEFESQDVEGLTTRVRIRDYLFNADQLVLSTGTEEPRSGDEIDDGTDTFEVYAPGGAEEPFRYSDHAHTRLRIHTREIS